jgi:hypothetical protein
MNTSRVSALFAVAFLVYASAHAQTPSQGGSSARSASEAPANPPKPSTPPPVAPAPGPVNPVIPPADSNASGTVAVKTASEQTWERIRDYTFENRTEFMAGLKEIQAQMEKSVEALKARRTTFTGDPGAWDSEMKRLDDARIYLDSMASALAKATTVNWIARRDDVARAWDRLQGAYARASDLVIP